MKSCVRVIVSVCEACQATWLQKKDCSQRRPGWAGG